MFCWTFLARGHQRADTLKPYSQKISQSNHTRTTALSNSMKLSQARGATQDGRVMVERSDRMWSTGEGNGKPLQYSCLENSMDGGAWRAIVRAVSMSQTQVRKGGGEEIPLIQGKEQWLRFAGAALKRYPTPKVRETQVRW